MCRPAGGRAAHRRERLMECRHQHSVMANAQPRSGSTVPTITASRPTSRRRAVLVFAAPLGHHSMRSWLSEEHDS